MLELSIAPNKLFTAQLCVGRPALDNLYLQAAYGTIIVRSLLELMYRYKYNKNYHHKSRRARRTGVIAIVLVSIAAIAGAVIAVDTILQSTRQQQPSSQPTYSTVRGANTTLFRTQYFQFQTNDSWQEIATESKDDYYVYRSFNGPIIEHDIIIEVNKKTPEVEALVRTTHVLPVTVDGDGKLTSDQGVGEHCNIALPKDVPKIPTRVKHKNVSFICSVDAVLYQVKVGLTGGTTDMQLPRPDGTRATYSITYRNLKFSPDDNTVKNIINTFQTR
jgi:hypothetical protein